MLDKDQTIKELDLLCDHLRFIRDNQEAIPCIELEEHCKCNDFDIILDNVERLINDFRIAQEIV